VLVATDRNRGNGKADEFEKQEEFRNILRDVESITKQKFARQ